MVLLNPKAFMNCANCTLAFFSAISMFSGVKQRASILL